MNPSKNCPVDKCGRKLTGDNPFCYIHWDKFPFEYRMKIKEASDMQPHYLAAGLDYLNDREKRR